jgi:hypothetical protein
MAARFHIFWNVTTVAKRLARRFAFGRWRVQIPEPAALVWVFSGIFPHQHILGNEKLHRRYLYVLPEPRAGWNFRKECSPRRVKVLGGLKQSFIKELNSIP